ncbi:MAG: nitroreductase family protein [Thermoleophilia bacterium]|nr:nitroreductase family protein [Thermoleophilia bacterium]
MDTIPVPNILARRSVRRYTAEPVTEEQITTLLKAAMAAPSAANRRPWHFVVVTERKVLDTLAERHPYAKMLFEAPLCIAVVGEPAVSDYWVQDCSAAAENILLAAAGMGLGSVWLGVHPRAEREQMVREVLGIPAGLVPLCLIAVGHPAEHPPARTQYDPARVHYQRW